MVRSYWIPPFCTLQLSNGQHCQDNLLVVDAAHLHFKVNTKKFSRCSYRSDSVKMKLEFAANFGCFKCFL